MGGRSASTSTSQNTSSVQDRRVAAENSTVVTAEGNLTQNIVTQVTDNGAGQRAADLSQAAVVGSAVVGRDTAVASLNTTSDAVSKSLGAVGGVTDKAFTFGGRALDENAAVVKGGYGLARDAMDATGTAMEKALGFVKASDAKAFDFAQHAFDGGLSQSNDAMRAVMDTARTSGQQVASAYERAMSGITSAANNATAAQARSADAIASAYQKTQDTSSGNRSLYIAGGVAALLVALLVIGPRLKV